MRVADLLKDKEGKPVISFEFSRPKTEKAAASLEKALDHLAAAKPDYVSVTFGAGGSKVAYRLDIAIVTAELFSPLVRLKRFASLQTVSSLWTKPTLINSSFLARTARTAHENFRSLQNCLLKNATAKIFPNVRR